MKISNLYENKDTSLISFEIFPPKKELNLKELGGTLSELALLNPAFISVTYSAGGTGGNSEKTAAICKNISEEYNIPSMAHLTCINSDRQKLQECIELFKNSGIENVLALRGDLLPGSVQGEFQHANEIIPLIKEAGFCVGAACYPEGHVSCLDIKEDIALLKLKQEAGADFFVSQLFFSNTSFYSFMDEVRKVGVTKPVEAGVMPILSRAQISRMVFMCGASLPSEIVRILNRYESDEDVEKAGIEYAAKQIKELLASGADAVHIYTMNRPHIAKGILEIVNG